MSVRDVVMTTIIIIGYTGMFVISVCVFLINKYLK